MNRPDYRLSKLFSDIVNLNDRFGSAIDAVIAENAPEARRLFAAANDTHAGMTVRDFRKILEGESFETILSTETRYGTCRVYGRPCDGVVVTASEAGGRVRDAVAEMSLTEHRSLGFAANTIFCTEARRSFARMRFDPTDGFRLRLERLKVAPGIPVPYWWHHARNGTSMESSFLVTRYDWYEIHGVPLGAVVPFRMSPAIREEHLRRFGLLPDEWKHRLDFEGSRTAADALEISGIEA